MNSIITQGMSKIMVNDQLVEHKQYMGSYDGEKGKLLMRSGNKGIYIELDNNDLAEVFQKREFGEKNEKSIDKKLKTLIKKHRTLKNVTSKGKKKRKTKNKRRKKKGLIKRNKKSKRRKKRRNKRKTKSYKDIITPNETIFD